MVAMARAQHVIHAVEIDCSRYPEVVIQNLGFVTHDTKIKEYYTYEIRLSTFINNFLPLFIALGTPFTSDQIFFVTFFILTVMSFLNLFLAS